MGSAQTPSDLSGLNFTCLLWKSLNFQTILLDFLYSPDSLWFKFRTVPVWHRLVRYTGRMCIQLSVCLQFRNFCFSLRPMQGLLFPPEIYWRLGDYNCFRFTCLNFFLPISRKSFEFRLVLPLVKLWYYSLFEACLVSLHLQQACLDSFNFILQRPFQKSEPREFYSIIPCYIIVNRYI